MRTPWHHLRGQVIQYPNSCKVYNLMQQHSARSTNFSMQWTWHHQSGQTSFHQAFCGTFRTVPGISSMVLSSQRPTGVDQRCTSLSTLIPFPFSSNVYNNVQDFANLLICQLLKQFSMDPCLRAHKSVTKSLFQSLFYTEYHQAILALEANKKLLHLCTHHWKAEVMISQVFLWRGSSGAEIKHEHSITLVPLSITLVPLSIIPVPSSIAPVPLSVTPVLSSIALVPSSVVPVPMPVVPMPMHWDMEDISLNTTSKHPLELSPGPEDFKFFGARW